MNYSIGVVTYHARFDTYFKPLIKKLVATFPDKEIICIINGHPDRTLQINYLTKVTTFLSQYKNIRYLTYDLHQSLAKCWNQLAILSATEKILIMNDDTQVTELFRKEFEEKVIDKAFSTLNQSWSHFLISKDIIKKVGWFDERLLGVGHEDADYALRMAIANVPTTDTTCLGLNNYVVSQEDPGWKSISSKVADNKYTQQNLDFFKEKWNTMDHNPGTKASDYTYILHWGTSEYPFSAKTTETTPLFYDLSTLAIESRTTKNVDVYRNTGFKIFFQKLFYLGKALLKKVYRAIAR